MAKDEKDFARQPGAYLVNRYMPGTSLAAREEALENLRNALRALMKLEEGKMLDRGGESSNPVGSQDF